MGIVEGKQTNRQGMMQKVREAQIKCQVGVILVKMCLTLFVEWLGVEAG